MQLGDSIIFIDTNKYLDLYRTDKCKKLLAPLSEQVEYIFVPQQVVDEVQRNKVQVAADFLRQKCKELRLQTFNIPDHLSGSNADQGKNILQEMKEIGQKIRKTNEDVDALSLKIMDQISGSEDEVSKALAPIFNKAVPHTPEELERARNRRELGNPPGKSTNPIGDQLIWEQILDNFQGKKRLWIISRDEDYGTEFNGELFLNRFLFEELFRVSPEVKVYHFADMVKGIEHFIKTTGVKAEKQLTPEEVSEIFEEETSLPPLRMSRPLSLEELHSRLRISQPLSPVDAMKVRAMTQRPSLTDALNAIGKNQRPSLTDSLNAIGKNQRPSLTDALNAIGKNQRRGPVDPVQAASNPQLPDDVNKFHKLSDDLKDTNKDLASTPQPEKKDREENIDSSTLSTASPQEAEIEEQKDSEDAIT